MGIRENIDRLLSKLDEAARSGERVKTWPDDPEYPEADKIPMEGNEPRGLGGKSEAGGQSATMRGLRKDYASQGLDEFWIAGPTGDGEFELQGGGEYPDSSVLAGQYRTVEGLVYFKSKEDALRHYPGLEVYSADEAPSARASVPGVPPEGFDPADAGERWSDDDVSEASVKMDPRLASWTPDQVAETLPVSSALSSRLWELLSQISKGRRVPQGGDPAKDPGTVEFPPEPDSHMSGRMGAVWRKLTDAEKAEINAAIKKELGDREKYRQAQKAKADADDPDDPESAALRAAGREATAELEKFWKDLDARKSESSGDDPEEAPRMDTAPWKGEFPAEPAGDKKYDSWCREVQAYTGRLPEGLKEYLPDLYDQGDNPEGAARALWLMWVRSTMGVSEREFGPLQKAAKEMWDDGMSPDEAAGYLTARLRGESKDAEPRPAKPAAESSDRAYTGTVRPGPSQDLLAVHGNDQLSDIWMISKKDAAAHGLRPGDSVRYAVDDPEDQFCRIIGKSDAGVAEAYRRRKPGRRLEAFLKAMAESMK